MAHYEKDNGPCILCGKLRAGHQLQTYPRRHFYAPYRAPRAATPGTIPYRFMIRVRRNVLDKSTLYENAELIEWNSEYVRIKDQEGKEHRIGMEMGTMVSFVCTEVR